MRQKAAATQRLSVIDLGTNTFHILIAEPTENGSFNSIFRRRIFVKLGENGLENIGAQAYQRGLDAIQAFKQILDEYEIKHLMAFGTAALRSAENGLQFIADVKASTGISIQLIDGQQEATYIYQGVVQIITFDQNPKLIMDIGGGSVEYIIATQDGIQWAQSFPIGLSVLYNKFHRANPISTEETRAMYQFLDEVLQPLFHQLTTFPITQLIGAAGTFDVLEQANEIQCIYAPGSSIPAQVLQSVFERIIHTTLEERLQIPNLPHSRADMIVVAFLLIQYTIQKANIQELVISPYALKEGILAEMLKHLAA